MFGVLPIEEKWKLAVTSRLASVLSSRLTIHLKNRAARLADQTSHQINVVDLASCGSRLIGLVDPLQAGRNQRRRGAKQLGSRQQIGFLNTANLMDSFRWVVTDCRLQALKPTRVAADKFGIQVLIANQKMKNAI